MAKEYAISFYNSKMWKRVRRLAIERSNGSCERCSLQGEITVHTKLFLVFAGKRTDLFRA